jgi:hypothetical protein
MSLSMYQASVPVFLRALTNLSAILGKGEAFAAAKKIEPAVLLQSRLAADMLPLTKQVQIVSDTVKGAVARLSGIENPSYADTETTFAELQERIAKTVAFVKSATEKQIDGTEKKTISMKVGGNELSFEGQAYLFGFVIPNVFFHSSIAYAILRHNGVELGKKDFLGNQ